LRSWTVAIRVGTRSSGCTAEPVSTSTPCRPARLGWSASGSTGQEQTLGTSPPPLPPRLSSRACLRRERPRSRQRRHAAPGAPFAGPEFDGARNVVPHWPARCDHCLVQAPWPKATSTTSSRCVRYGRVEARGRCPSCRHGYAAGRHPPGGSRKPACWCGGARRRSGMCPPRFVRGVPAAYCCVELGAGALLPPDGDLVREADW